MSKTLPDHINAGEILLNEVCKLAGIENWRFISATERKELNDFICDSTGCSIDLKSLGGIFHQNCIKPGQNSALFFNCSFFKTFSC